MEVTFLTPLGALFALAAAVPLLVFRARERRARLLRATLGLPEPSTGSRLTVALALAGVCALLALAAAQPVVATTRELRERTDAQVFVVLDSSRSMLASAEPGAPTRFERAQQIAARFADRLPEVPIGLASLTDRLLPHLFPTTDRRVLTETLTRTMGVEAPPASNFYVTSATTFDALVAVRRLSYFPPAIKKRVLVVLTDGETRATEEDLASTFRRAPRIETVFVHLWGPEERIYLTGVAEIGYKPDPNIRPVLDRVAASISARVLAEDRSGELSEVVAGLLDDGPAVSRRHEGRRVALMPWITLASVIPLGLVLRRRNFSAQRAGAAGSSTMNVEPSPSLDSTQIFPSIRRTSSRQM